MRQLLRFANPRRKDLLHWSVWGAIVTLALLPVVASGQTFYQCLGAQGRLEFSTRPCTRGSGQPTDTPTDTPAVQGPAAPGLLEQLDQHIARRQPATPNRPPAARVPSPGAPHVQIVQPPAR